MEVIKPYLQHDLGARNTMELLTLRADLGHKGKAIFWDVVEFMHENKLPTNHVSILAKHLEVELEFLQKVLDRKDLFYIENNEYISNRVLRNLFKVENNKANKKKAADARWEKDRREKAEQNPTGGESPDTEVIQGDDEIITAILDYYSTTLDIKYNASMDVREQIAQICNKNNEIVFKNKFLENWQLIFDNAKKGWKLKDGKKKPTLKTILKEWNAFLNNDYYLDETYLSPAEEEIAEQLQQADTCLSDYNEYKHRTQPVKLEAQSIYREILLQEGEQAAIKAAVLFCREQA